MLAWKLIRSATLRTRLVALVLLAMLPLACMLLAGAVLDRQVMLDSARGRVLQMAKLGAERHGDVLQEARTLLEVLSHVPEARGSDVHACHALLRRLVVERPGLGVVSVIDRSAQVVCNSASASPRVSVGDRPYIRRLLAADSQGFDVGDVVMSRVTGDPLVYVGLALPPEPGGDRPARVLAAGVNLNWLSSLASSVAQENRSVAVVVNARDGAVLARYPDNSSWVGRLFPNSAGLIAYRANHNEAGVTEGKGPDGVDRIYGYAPLPGTHGEAVLILGSARDQVLAAVNQRMAIYLVLMVLATSAAVAGAMLGGWFMLVRPSTQIMEAASRMGAGDLDARAEIQPWHAPELHRLAGTLNGLAVDFSAAQSRLADSGTRYRLLAGTDGLTGLANRRMFDETLEREWRRAAREQTVLSALLLDVDFFKRFNDRYGHLAGDQCLRTVAAALNNALQRPGDMVARYGGEEFVVLLPRTAEAGALEIAERVRTAVAACAITHAGTDDPGGLVSVSIGMTTAMPAEAEDDCTSAVFVGRADAALYAAKKAGRNCVRRSLPLTVDGRVRRREATVASMPGQILDAAPPRFIR